MCPRATSFDNLPRINQRREVDTDHVHLKFDFIAILNYGANDSVLDFPVVQVDADFVADFELSVIGLGWHGRNVPQTRKPHFWGFVRRGEAIAGAGAYPGAAEPVQKYADFSVAAEVTKHTKPGSLVRDLCKASGKRWAALRWSATAQERRGNK
jgi:hypothetical protein